MVFFCTRRELTNFFYHFQESTSYIRTVFWCCICLQLFIHPSLLHLLPIPIIYTLIKKLWSKFGSKLTDLLNNHSSLIQEFFKKRKEAFFPNPVRYVASELYKIERECLKTLPKFLDTLVTILLILIMIVGLILAIAFISVQMYSETVYIVQTSGKLVSNAANRYAKNFFFLIFFFCQIIFKTYF